LRNYNKKENWMVFNSDLSVTMLLPEKLFVMTFETSTFKVSSVSCGRGPGECVVMSKVLR